MNASFCSLAWVGVTTDPDGTLRPCCVSGDRILKDDGTPYNIGVDKLETIYNSNYYKRLRHDMLKGTKISGCDTCYNNENIGRESRRLINNEVFKDQVFDKTTSDINVQYLDLRLGNQCNLKCRMCSPMNSSMIEDEFKNNYDPVLDKAYLKSNMMLRDWYETTVFDDNINSHLPNLKTLYMTGGEPTLIKKNYDIMQRLIDCGRNEKVTLIINTNMTNSNPKFYQLLKQFKKVVIQMSIDAVDDLATYIRHPSDFKVVDSTIKELLSIGDNISLVAGPVIQILNLNRLVELFDYLESFNRQSNKLVIDIRPGFVFMPEHNNIQYLPKQYKIDCYRKIYMWMMNNSKYQSMQFRNTINALKNKCYDDGFDSDKLKNFLEFNTALDRIRNTSLEKANPELYNTIKSYA
jgi:organic radical activating enzyme